MVQIDPAELAQYRAAKSMLATYTKIVNGYKARFQLALGDDTEGKVGDEQVFSYGYVDQHRDAEFAKQHPVLFEKFSQEKTTRVVDWALLGYAHPDLVKEFQTRKFLDVK